MPVLRDFQIKESVDRSEVVTNVAGSAIITKVIAGNYISLTSSGADIGTGDVTIGVNSTSIPHSNLTNRDLDDHSQYVHKTVARTITAQHTFSTTGSPFIISGSSVNAKVTGLNADMVDGYSFNQSLQTSDNAHFNRVDITEPTQNYNPFGGGKLFDSIGTNILAGKWNKLTVTIDGVVDVNAPKNLTDLNYEKFSITNLAGIDGGAAKVININFTGWGTSGVTYASGFVEFCFYSQLGLSTYSARVKDKNGTWTNMPLLVVGCKLRGTIPISNWLTDIEITLTPLTGGHYIYSNYEYCLAQVEYHITRISAGESAIVSSVGGYIGGNLILDAPIGTSPLIVTSTTKVANLNADLFDGDDSTKFVKVDAPNTIIAQHTFQMNDGVAPFLLSCQGSPGKVVGFNADLLDGNEASAFATSAQGTKADNALPASSYTASDILTKIKTVDGMASGLDADFLDGIHYNQLYVQLVRDSANPNAVASIPVSGRNTTPLPNAYQYCVTTEFKATGYLGISGNSSSYVGLMTVAPFNGTTASGGDGNYQIAFTSVDNTVNALPNLYLRNGYDTAWNNWYKLWHSGNSGSGSGLDADKVDGLEGTVIMQNNVDNTIAKVNPRIYMNALSGSAYTGLELQNLGAGKAWYGLSTGSGSYITGSVTNDACIRSTQKILMSADNGVSIGARLDSNGTFWAKHFGDLTSGNAGAEADFTFTDANSITHELVFSNGILIADMQS